jgi:hypothetical protein
MEEFDEQRTSTRTYYKPDTFHIMMRLQAESVFSTFGRPQWRTTIRYGMGSKAR